MHPKDGASQEHPNPIRVFPARPVESTRLPSARPRCTFRDQGVAVDGCPHSWKVMEMLQKLPGIQAN